MDYRKEIEEKGFLVLPDLISNHDCDHYKSILESNYEIYAPNYAKNSASGAHGLDNKSMEKTVYNLHNKDLSFYKLFEHPEVLKILDFMLLEGSIKMPNLTTFITIVLVARFKATQDNNSTQIVGFQALIIVLSLMFCGL